LFERHGFKVIRMAGKPIMFYIYFEEMQDMLKDPEKARKILNLELKLCEEESLIGYGGHLHIVAQRVIKD
jgi:hypothetical protein